MGVLMLWYFRYHWLIAPIENETFKQKRQYKSLCYKENKQAGYN